MQPKTKFWLTPMAGLPLEPSSLQEHEGNVEPLPFVDQLRRLLAHAKLIRDKRRHKQQHFVAEAFPDTYPNSIAVMGP
eukprot:7691666-Karenia_brevis.AAC.1